MWTADHEQKINSDVASITNAFTWRRCTIQFQTLKSVLIVIYSILNHIGPGGSCNCWIHKIPGGDRS